MNNRRRFLSRVWMGWLALSLAGVAGCAQPVVSRTNPVDGQVRVRVPAGSFQMGTSASQAADLASLFGLAGGLPSGEAPQFSLALPEFYIDRTPVTNAQYKAFLAAHPGWPVPYLDDSLAASYNWDKAARSFPPGRDQYPVVLVTWRDAAAYCQWAGGRLPTEAEWEKAARGTDARLWPWGNTFDATRLNSAEAGLSDATPVGHFLAGASPYGALDMAGNVWQWTSSLDRAYPYSATDGREDPGAGGARVTRGGAWLFGGVADRTAMRNRFDPDSASLSIGFRCAQ
jgi:formylglycine-generating enzyme required for sulfatase activity